MSSLQRLVINSNGTALDFISQCNLKPLGLDGVNSFADYIQGLTGGNVAGASLHFKIGAVQATGTITSTGAATAAQAMTLLNVTLTAIGSAPGDNQFVPSATVGIQAANIAAAINASTTLSGKVIATAALGVVTVTSVVPGILGNGFQISAGTLANVSVGAFANGSDGTAYNIDLR
jgi:hypothetical protein